MLESQHSPHFIVADPEVVWKYQLSLQELLQLDRLLATREARVWLYDHQVSCDKQDAQRLAFARWLLVTHRLREE